MKTFPVKFIYAGWGLSVFTVLFAFAASFSRWFLIFAVICLAAFSLLMRKAFRCPHCGGSINLNHMTRAMNQPYFCFHCGKQIIVSGGKTGGK